MNAFLNIGNIINFVLILLSLSVSAWCIYRCKRGNKRRKLYYTGIALSLLVIALCIRGSYKIFHYCDLYNKIVRPTKSYYLNELTLSPEECREDFEEIMGIVQENYASLAHHKHIDLAKLNEAYKEEVSGVKDAEQYGLLLLQYFSALKNMHTYPFFSRYQSGVYAVSRNDSVWISRCLNKSVDLQRKDLIIAIDGMLTADYIKKEMEITPASTDMARKKTAAINIFASYTDTCKQVTVQRGDSVFNVLLPLFKEEEMIVALKKQANATDSSRIYLPSVIAPKVSSLLAKTLKRYDNIGYIRIHDFDPGSVEDFCRQIKEEFKCPYLILNLQGNLGGKKGNVMNIASYLISYYDKMYDSLPSASNESVGSKEELHFTAYPNPATDRFFVQTYGETGRGGLQVIGLDGKVWHSYVFNSGVELNGREFPVWDMPQGVYVIRIQTERQNGIYKIVVQ